MTNTLLDTVHNKDCLEGLKDIPDGAVDLIVTDPQYCIGATGNGKKSAYTDNNLMLPFFRILFDEMNRVCKENAALYINTDWRTYPLLYPLLQSVFNVRNLIVWDYEWIKAGTHYRFSHEFIMYATKGDFPRSFPPAERDVWRIRPINFT